MSLFTLLLKKKYSKKKPTVTNIKTNKRLVRQKKKKITKQGKKKQEVYNNITEFVSCWLATFGNGACPEMLCIYQVRLSFPFSLVSVSDGFWFRGGNLCPLLLLSNNICLDCICTRLRCAPQSIRILMCISSFVSGRQCFFGVFGK